MDLCRLAARANDHSLTNLVATLLFGDGAAGVVLCCPTRGERSVRSWSKVPRILATGEHLYHDTKDYLGLDIKDDGFGMVLSAQLPKLEKANLGPSFKGFLNRQNLSIMDFDGFLIHAGGRKYLESVEKILGVERAQIVHAWDVMCDYDNMSLVTVLFVLQRAMVAGEQGRHLIAAFGFGFSAHFAVVDL